MILAQMSRSRDVDALEGRITTQSTGRTRHTRAQLVQCGIACI
jgi:hypothetical protein